MGARRTSHYPGKSTEIRPPMSNTRSIWHNDYLGLVSRLVVGLIFIYASLDKIGDPAQFARIIYNYHLLPGQFINLASLIMPWVELICGVALILGPGKDGAILVLNALVAVFIVAIAINLVRGVDLECGCFTVSSKAKSNALNLLIRDVGLLALGLYAMFNKATRFFLFRYPA